ncbi:indolepyruvate oxidoreductase subunit beta [Heliophilum fasciatum]|uniref:Indolepyruvate ferredoxin oxidoreductase beta subunit n=1 Tax=Heliophilum fasciatum TaxID=35700 RepID=A0A4R2RH72_9FIRM|nr:indolepyruvate oxidoreductase subunit beta [Heliophilum fasciatum]MCW2278959.1 indolepyruvate ferredoxin oxidoreductase beta subunit [Heliophilum fasciatum]TCP61789.1 indolepyruvate ferredoxin oxidoreductase beta subunit [Heliophilum fasciatum]
MSETKNILLVGVGGQGTILASKILAHVALGQGWDVKMSEIHGMAQRGGSVVTQVRIGTKVYSPIIEPGEADVLVAFEQLEAYRWIHTLRPDGTVIINDQKIAPLPVVAGAATYPETILDDIRAKVATAIVVPALSLATEAGNSKATNVVLMGVLASVMPDVPAESWQEALEANVPVRFLEVNRKAFAAGFACER